MNRVQILDCTLRDGGYCNQWKFGEKNKKIIVNGLCDANTDIIECGYLTERAVPDKDSTKFTSVDAVNEFIKTADKNRLYVVMVNYGEYDSTKIPPYRAGGVEGIRVAFHKKDMNGALKYCRQLKEKGYKVFVQPMISMNYSDIEFIDMIEKVNEIRPYAFYIVDSFGMMKKKNLLRLFYMVEHNLCEQIQIGFHSHNNLQLAYSNAQSLIETQTRRRLIVDACVYGMGRGAGNLNTELFADYLNEYTGSHYKIKPLLQIIDEVLNDFYKRSSWGYSLSRYLSASYALHPNYAAYLEDKNTLTLEAMDDILSKVDDEKKTTYDKMYIESLYVQYMESVKSAQVNLEKLKAVVKDKKVLLIAPGKSIEKEKSCIEAFAAKEDVIPVSINFAAEYSGYIFISNLIRYRDLEPQKRDRCIVTTNIKDDKAFASVKYEDLIASEEGVRDNAGLMAVKLMILLGKEKVYLAGFDGYSHNSEENYASSSKMLITKAEIADTMNKGMQAVINRYKKQIEIEFITESVYNEEQ